MTDYILLEKFSKNINVLYVEDDINVRKETAELLQDIFEKPISIAVDGKDGFNKYMEYYKNNNEYFDLILTDIMMPNINGIDLTKMIYDKNPNQSVIVISAYNDSDNLLRLVNIGIEQFVLKPFQRLTLCLLSVLFALLRNSLSFCYQFINVFYRNLETFFFPSF